MMFVNINIIDFARLWDNIRIYVLIFNNKLEFQIHTTS